MNKLSTGVTLTVSSTQPTNARTGANVWFEAINGTVTFASFRGPVQVTVAGNSLNLNGHTAAVAAGPNDPRIGQAFCCVPITPQVLAGHTGQQRQREAGHPIKVVIAMHELIHAIGLTVNSDHSRSPNPDVFFDQNSASPGFPLDFNHPENDYIVLQDTGKIPPPTLPPYFLNPQTVNKIIALWVLPSTFVHFPHFARPLGI